MIGMRERRRKDRGNGGTDSKIKNIVMGMMGVAVMIVVFFILVGSSGDSNNVRNDVLVSDTTERAEKPDYSSGSDETDFSNEKSGKAQDVIKSEEPKIKAGYLASLSLEDIESNDDKLNEVKQYIDMCILDDFFESGEHFADHFGEELFEMYGLTGYTPDLMYNFLEKLRGYCSEEEFIYVLNVEEVGDYYRAIITTAGVGESGYGTSSEYCYEHNGYLSFYISIFEIDGQYRILPFDVRDIDIYSAVFGCGQGRVATNVEQYYGETYLLDAMRSGAACDDVSREAYLMGLQESKAAAAESAEKNNGIGEIEGGYRIEGYDEPIDNSMPNYIIK